MCACKPASLLLARRASPQPCDPIEHGCARGGNPNRQCAAPNPQRACSQEGGESISAVAASDMCTSALYSGALQALLLGRPRIALRCFQARSSCPGTAARKAAHDRSQDKQNITGSAGRTCGAFVPSICVALPRWAKSVRPGPYEKGVRWGASWWGQASRSHGRQGKEVTCTTKPWFV